MSSVNALSSIELVSEKHHTKRVVLLLGILVAFAPLLTVGLFGEWLGDGTVSGATLLNLAYVMSIGLATIVLKRLGSGWRDIGLARPASWPKTVLLGFGTLVVFVVASNVLGAAIQYFLAPEMAAADRSSYDPLVGNLPLLILMVAAAWTTFAFGEEMIFRAFLTNMLAGFVSHSKARWAIALVGSSLVFGLAHFSWGLAGIIETTILGLVLNIVYLSTGRNLWVTIIAHGIGNTLSFILIYSGVV
jgi:membrane protease YdiL (CAAX protease family)